RFSMPVVLHILIPFAYRKPGPPLNRFSNRSYLQRVHATTCLTARTHTASRCPVISPSRGHTTTVRAEKRILCSSNCAANLAIVSHFFQKTSPGSRTKASGVTTLFLL